MLISLDFFILGLFAHILFDSSNCIAQAVFPYTGREQWVAFNLFPMKI